MYRKCVGGSRRLKLKGEEAEGKGGACGGAFVMYPIITHLLPITG